MTDRPPPSGPWILAKDVRFSHGRQKVLKGIDLTFSPGRHYVVTGPNGAGKSTFLDILASLRKPESGTVSLRGAPIDAYAANERARLLSLAPQEYNLGFSFTVREMVAMGRRPYLGRWGVLEEEDHAAVDEAVRFLHLEDLAHKSVTALSGGERRRCVVARALAQQTPVVLLDEPTAGLDVAQALSLMELCRSLAERGRLIVTVSHDLNLAATYAHEMIFLKGGRVAAAGAVETVFTGPTLARVYETDAKVEWDSFSGGPSVSFRPFKKNGGIRGALDKRRENHSNG